ncbi:metal-dependent transcriptional regulator [Fuchsiella alkaliacetigena]|uniref:metal-dependent transcriptional regulator n=1 Tax=Fuchsiella alkaliacetigena TaxID=957042 RepID=UPI00200A5C65|nr:iron dependent repressor, metal binding and dimerization domain protein [Fuchsiella alkaliacetigena]MCK8825204.1 DNA-binding protein [Fuchsiella alkaliacetigena]
MLSPSLEDYLEESYRFYKEKGFIRPTDIALKLNVSLPSVTKAVKKLNQKGYLNYQRYQNIELTKKGLKLGSFLVRRNQLLIDFLEVIGSKCDKEQEAEAMEHYLSKETVQTITHLVEFFKKHPEYQQKFFKFKKDKITKQSPVDNTK